MMDDIFDEKLQRLTFFLGLPKPYPQGIFCNMQMPESSSTIRFPIQHLLNVICGFDSRYILRFFSQITSAIPTIFLKIGETGDKYHRRKLKAM